MEKSPGSPAKPAAASAHQSRHFVLLGGTFDSLHVGHEKIIDTAYGLGGKVLLCMTSDGMAKLKHYASRIDPYEERKKNVEAYLKQNKWFSRTQFVKIEDPFTEGLRPRLTHVVVSLGSRPNADIINRMRKARGLEPLKIVGIGWIVAENGRPVSDTLIRRGEMDRKGRTTKPHRHLGIS